MDLEDAGASARSSPTNTVHTELFAKPRRCDHCRTTPSTLTPTMRLEKADPEHHLGHRTAVVRAAKVARHAAYINQPLTQTVVPLKLRIDALERLDEGSLDERVTRSAREP